MPKRLSIFCCLPRKQRDNLSSRALYHDQDSSSGLDDYSGDEDDHYYHDRYRNSPARLEALRPSLARDSAESTTTPNPWPSSLSNGRLSRQANHHRHPRQSSSLGSRSQRKPNPFRAEGPYRDDTSSEDDNEDSDEDGGCNRIARASSSRTRKSIFKPYRDDESDDDAEALREHQYTTTTSLTDQEGPTQIQDAPRIYPKMAYTPYRVETGVLTSQATNPRRMRTPRNPQVHQQVASWQDEDEDKRGQSSADAADAEEVIDVDALIAEQERITRELAAQEEVLRKEEEDLIQKKKLAAIHAAEKRGLLRFEGGQLVIPSSGENNNTSNHVSSNAPHSGISEPKGPHMRQDGGDETWNRSGRVQSIVVPMDRTTSSSAASSYVGGIDAFDQELKLMSLDVKDNHKEKKTPSGFRSSAASTPTLIPTTDSPVRPPIAVRTVSTGVSTSTSTFVVSPTLNINPRGVFNNITSFLKKVDGVIAGESSSDEASFSDQEQHLDKKKSNNNNNNNSNGSDNNQGTEEPAIVKMRSQGMASLHSSGSGQMTGGYSTSAAERDQQAVRTVAVNVDPVELQDPPHLTLTGDHSDDTIIYPTDAFNGPSEIKSGRESPTGSSLSTLGSRASSIKQRPMDDQESGQVQPAAVLPSSQPLSPTTATSTAAAASERIFDTFTSLFNSGSSFMGLFGTGQSPEDDARMHSDNEKHGRRLSSLKYGDPTKHRFNYREHRLDDDGPLAGDSWMGRKATPVANTTTSTAVHASMDDDDDGDSSSIDDYDF